MKKLTILRTISVVVIIVIGFLGMNALGTKEINSNKRDLKPEIRTVEAETLKYGNFPLLLNGNGVIEPQKTLRIVAETSGKVNFAKNNLKSGTFIKQGETVLKIDSRETENSLYSKRSDFLNTVAALLPELKIDNADHYKKWHEYFQSIEINEAIPELPVVTDSQEKIKVSSRNIFTKYYDVKNREILLSKYDIKAPFDGYIQSNGIIENSIVSIGQELFTLNDVVNLEIAVPLLVGDLNQIDFAKKTPVKIYGPSNIDDALTGYIVRSETNLEKNSQSLFVYVNFRNPKLQSAFFPGNYVDVEIEGKTMFNVARVHRNLIVDDSFIYTKEDGKLGRRSVNVLHIQDDMAIISNTLPENTSIVKTILQKPLIGMEIQTTDELAASDSTETDSSVSEDIESVAAISN